MVFEGPAHRLLCVGGVSKDGTFKFSGVLFFNFLSCVSLALRADSDCLNTSGSQEPSCLKYFAVKI